MQKFTMFAFITPIFLIGCSMGVVNKATTLREQPFSVETMRGTVKEAIRCVGRYWRKEALPPEVWWKVNPESLPVLASGIGVGKGEPPVSLVIDFNDEDGLTIARAYMHRSISIQDERRALTIQSLAACRDNTRSYYQSVKALVLKNGDIIEGQIISSDHDVIKLRSKEGKVLTYSFINDIQKYIYK